MCGTAVATVRLSCRAAWNGGDVIEILAGWDPAMSFLLAVLAMGVWGWLGFRYPVGFGLLTDCFWCTYPLPAGGLLRFSPLRRVTFSRLRKVTKRLYPASALAVARFLRCGNDPGAYASVSSRKTSSRCVGWRKRSLRSHPRSLSPSLRRASIKIKSCTELTLIVLSMGEHASAVVFGVGFNPHTSLSRGEGAICEAFRI